MKTVRSRAGMTARFIAAAALGLTGLAVAAAPVANASAVSGFVNGPIGVTQTISVTNLAPSSFGQQTCSLSPTINGNLYSPVVGSLVNGTATFVWTPTAVGAATFTITDCATTDGVTPSAAVTISPVSTSTTVSAPNNAQVGVATQITVTVQSASPSSNSPAGQVVVKDINGATLATMGLTKGPGTGQSYAYYRWTPPAAGSYTFQATYSGDANDTASTSPQDVVIATPSGNPITLTHPAQMTQGVPVTLTATVYPQSIQGSVGFTVNGAPISASIPLVNGVANYTWTPNVVGQVTIGASYTTNQGGSGSTSDKANIIAGPVATDAITLVQPGWGPWTPNGSYTLGNGSSFAFQASTLSGAPVTLSETGPCVVSGLTITVNQGAGSCNVVASSPGANGYAAVKSGYTVNLIPGVQQAPLNAPPSGSFKVGRVIVLESPSQQNTSAGQNITWKVKKGGKAVCKLLYPNDGSVTLRIAKRGSCTVLGTAAAVPGQWQKFQTARNYTGR